MYRYSNKAENTRFAPLLDMIDEKARHEAEVLGKAMRFAAMLWLNKDARPGEMRWFPKKKRLELRLTPEASPLFGEVAEERFKSLAGSLGAEVIVSKQPTNT